MKHDILKKMYIRYVSNMQKVRKEQIDIPVDQITKKKTKTR